MNKNLIAVALLSASAFSPAVFAADGKVNFTGEIIAQGCDITANTKDQTVELGKIAVAAFPGAGATAGSKNFTLELTNCPTTITAASVRFDGTQIPGDDSILALTDVPNVATGVGIQLADDQNKVINLHKPSSSYSLASGSAVNRLNFVARYVSTAAIVTAGPANAVSTFTIIY